MDLTAILALIQRIPAIAAELRKVGIPLSVVSGALRLVADAIDGIDRATAGR